MQKRIYTHWLPITSGREQDHHLAFKALHGDSSAWDTLYLSSFSFVLREVNRFDDQNVFTPDDYREIADEAFAKCHEQLERYRGLSRFRRWVLGYAKNIMRNRKSRFLTARRNQYVLQNMAHSRAIYLDPLYFLLRLERNQYLWAAFFQLSAPDRIILYQRLFFNTPPRELAKELQLTRKQVLQRYEEALLTVRWHFLRQYR